jgi:Flp pilus assembly pilin Flp
MFNSLNRFWQDEDGLETLEWAAIAAVLIVGAIAIYGTVSSKISAKLSSI